MHLAGNLLYCQIQVKDLPDLAFYFKSPSSSLLLGLSVFSGDFCYLEQVMVLSLVSGVFQKFLVVFEVLHYGGTH